MIPRWGIFAKRLAYGLGPFILGYCRQLERVSPVGFGEIATEGLLSQGDGFDGRRSG
jgi:hypothetical protein